MLLQRFCVWIIDDEDERSLQFQATDRRQTTVFVLCLVYRKCLDFWQQPVTWLAKGGKERKKKKKSSVSSFCDHSLSYPPGRGRSDKPRPCSAVSYLPYKQFPTHLPLFVFASILAYEVAGVIWPKTQCNLGTGPRGSKGLDKGRSGRSGHAGLPARRSAKPCHVAVFQLPFVAGLHPGQAHAKQPTLAH